MNTNVAGTSFEAEVVQARGIFAGVDEAGVGPLCGPVVAAAVVLDPMRPIEGLNDSKKLSEKKREKLYEVICQNALAYGIGEASVEEIDEFNILRATHLAMKRAIEAMGVSVDRILVDGNRIPEMPYPVEAIVGGDALIQEISAASILAKVTRDRLCMTLHEQYPHYGIDVHKGYPTSAHLKALSTHGPCAIYRQSFGPVKKLINADAGSRSTRFRP